MSLRKRGMGDHDVAPVWVRHPVAVPLGVAAIFAVAVLGFALVSSQRSSDGAEAVARGVVGSNRDATIRAVIRQTDDYERAVATFAEDSSIIGFLRAPKPGMAKEAVGRLSTLARSEGSPAAFLFDANGRNVVSYPERRELIGQDYSFRDWFKGVSSSDRPYVSEGFRSMAVGQPPTVAIAAPVDDGKTRLGYVVILWQLDSLSEVSKGAGPDGGVDLQVTDQSGQSLLDPLKVDSLGQPIVGSVPATTRKALAGHSVSTVVAGKILASGPVSGLGWTVSASLPRDVALAPAARFQRRQQINVGGALALILLFAAFASLLARRSKSELEDARKGRLKLQVSEERFRRVFDAGPTGKILVTTCGDILRVNATLSRVLATGKVDLIGRPLVSCFVAEEDRRQILDVIADGTRELRGEMAMQSASDATIWGLAAFTWIAEAEEQKVMLVQIEDITAQRDAEQRLSELDHLDELTGLPNRRLLLERCEQAFAVARSGRSEHSNVAALFIDLDGFKKVNDRAGREVGDRLLVSIAEDLNAVLRPSDTAARIGGDEFAVLIEHDDGLEHLQSVADRIIGAIRRQVDADGISLSVSASIGVARVDLSVEPDVDPDQLIKRADAAMYRAKERGRDRYDVFDSDLRASTESRQILEIAMRDGLRHDRISLVFQPIVDVDEHTVIGAEALMRLRDIGGQLMPTLSAIVAAEAAGLAEQLGDRVLDLALSEARNWPKDMSVAVNLSARELTGHRLRVRVEAALERYGFCPSRLILEITETSILRAGPFALAELENLRTHGVRVAIDDFGTGYATLQNLTTLPVDVLKVDTLFTAGLPHERAHSAIVHGIASMAHALDISCVIEGVETEEQLAAIRGMGVRAQGWLLGESRGPGHTPEMFSGLTR